MNTSLRNTIFALTGAVALGLGAVSVASADQYVIGGGNNYPAAGYGGSDSTVGPSFNGGANLALPFGGHVDRSANNCFDVIGQPGRHSQDEVSSCQHQTGTERGMSR